MEFIDFYLQFGDSVVDIEGGFTLGPKDIEILSRAVIQEFGSLHNEILVLEAEVVEQLLSYLPLTFAFPEKLYYTGPCWLL